MLQCKQGIITIDSYFSYSNCSMPPIMAAFCIYGYCLLATDMYTLLCFYPAVIIAGDALSGCKWVRFLLSVPYERCDMMELKIEYVPVDSIKPYKGNAKKHPKKQIEQIKQSIIAMKDADGDLLTGFKNPLGVWHNEIATGHGRYIAAKELGFETIPIIRLDSMTDEQRRAYIMIDNQLTLNTENDLKQLAIELESIKSIDMPSFSLDLPEIRLQLDELATADDFTIDDINEVDGYDEHNDDREYFEKTFTFPIAKKKQIVCYLKKHYDEVINRIIHDAEEGY